jgi:hypothetical protein
MLQNFCESTALIRVRYTLDHKRAADQAHFAFQWYVIFTAYKNRIDRVLSGFTSAVAF